MHLWANLVILLSCIYHSFKTTKAYQVLHNICSLLQYQEQQAYLLLDSVYLYIEIDSPNLLPMYKNNICCYRSIQKKKPKCYNKRNPLQFDPLPKVTPFWIKAHKAENFTYYFAVCLESKVNLKTLWSNWSRWGWKINMVANSKSHAVFLMAYGTANGNLHHLGDGRPIQCEGLIKLINNN